MELEKIDILHQYGIQPTEEMELQSHGTQGTNKEGKEIYYLIQTLQQPILPHHLNQLDNGGTTLI